MRAEGRPRSAQPTGGAGERRPHRFGLAAVVLIGLAVRPVVALACIGDCTGAGAVDISDLILGVDIVLGVEPPSACPAFENAQGVVDISQLIQGVNNLLNGCGPAPTTGTPAGDVTILSGSCSAPGGRGNHGFKPCNPGTAITVFRCDDRTQCLHQQGLTMVSATTVGDGGGWTVQVATTDASAALVFQASITNGVVYRALGFGTVGGAERVARAGSGSAATFAPVDITPVTEAAVQLLDTNGFVNYSDTGAQQVVNAVERATATLSFETVMPDMAATVAVQAASADPTVTMVLQTARNTPTAVATSSNSPTAMPTNTPTSTATPASFTEPFTGGPPSNWVFLGTATVTGDGSVDLPGDGWLRLTPAGNYLAGLAYYDTPVSSDRDIAVSFDFASWGGSGADGIAVVLFDGTTTAPHIGGSGGALGYGRGDSADGNVDGLANAYVGIGLDEYGGFAGIANAVGLRGSGNGQSGYDLLYGAGFPQQSLDFPQQASRPDQTGADYRHAIIEITAQHQVTVCVQFGVGGPLETAIERYDLGVPSQEAPPATFKVGLSGGTGYYTNFHEVRNVSVTLDGSPACPTTTATATATPTATASVSACACVVGTGTAASCTEDALTGCLPGGDLYQGLVIFNCGGAATIPVTGTKTIDADTIVDGGGLITIDGGNSVGVFSVADGVAFTVQNLTIADGAAGNGSGGGISNLGMLTVTNSTVSNNSADGAGAGIYNAGTATIMNTMFSGNTGAGPVGDHLGGAIFNVGTATISNSIFAGNSTTGQGAGSGIWNGGTATVTNSTFENNNTSGSGGGIFNNGTLTVTNSTFSANTGSGGGGVGNCICSGTTVITNSTFSGNAAVVGMGGNIDSYGTGTGAVTIANTIVANSASGDNCAGGIIDGGHNIDDGTTCGFTGAGCSDTSGTSICATNPGLDPNGLQSNGGPTETIALCTSADMPSAGCGGTSPAINAGDESVCSATTGNGPVDNLDQRGFIRPGDGATHCSIGAFEANATPCVDSCPDETPCTADSQCRSGSCAGGVCAESTPICAAPTPTATP